MASFRNSASRAGTRRPAPQSARSTPAGRPGKGRTGTAPAARTAADPTGIGGCRHQTPPYPAGPTARPRRAPPPPAPAAAPSARSAAADGRPAPQIARSSSNCRQTEFRRPDTPPPPQPETDSLRPHRPRASPAKEPPPAAASPSAFPTRGAAAAAPRPSVPAPRVRAAGRRYRDTPRPAAAQTSLTAAQSTRRTGRASQPRPPPRRPARRSLRPGRARPGHSDPRP